MSVSEAANTFKRFGSLVVNNKHAPNALVWLLLFAMPYWLPAYAIIPGLHQIIVLALAAMALNILLGYTGVLSLGHAAYFGLGAYGAGLSLLYLAHSTPLAILAGTLLGGLAGTVFGGFACMLLGRLTVRWHGLCFAVCTLAFGQLCFYAALRWKDLTGGFDGLQGFSPEPIGFGPFALDIRPAGTLYYFFLAIFAVAVALIGLLLRSPFGRTLIAIRENPRGARVAGISVERHLWLAFSISCFFTALAGTLYALLFSFVPPEQLHYSTSIELVVIAVLGGMRTFWGPLAGAVVYVVLRYFAMYEMMQGGFFFDGLIVALLATTLPRGLVLTARRLLDWLSHTKWRHSARSPAERLGELSAWYPASWEKPAPGFLEPYEQYLVKAPSWWKALRTIAAVAVVLVGVALGLVGLIAVNILPEAFSPDLVLRVGSSLAIGLSLGLVNMFCFLIVASFFARDGIAALQKDGRKPVLFLRSFKADAGLWRSWIDFAFKSGTAESSLVRAARGIGPVLALGPPGEKLPPLGAARFHVGHDHWQDLVKALEAEAALIILRIGLTESFWWEVKYLVETSAPEKIVVYLPPQDHRAVYAQFRSKVGDMLPQFLPDPLSNKALILSFAPDWSARQTDVKGPSIAATLRRRLLAGTMAPAVHEALVEAGYLKGRLPFSVRERIALALWTFALLVNIWMLMSVWMGPSLY
jgi:branched-chain amino acid transport system permease protein